MTSSYCIICTFQVKARPPRRSTKESLDDQLIVYFFLKKFLKFPLLVEWDPTGKNNTKWKDEVEDLLATQGNPSQWISFCSECHEWMDEAWKLHLELMKLEVRLDSLRSKVRRRVKETFQVGKDELLSLSDSSDSRKRIYKSVRRRICNVEGT
jgi:hypothetical protein